MAHPELNQLLNALIPFAQQALAKHGEYYPFGSAINKDGVIVAHVTWDGDENPPSQQVIDTLTKDFQQQAAAGQIRAAGICYDIRTVVPGQSTKTDAICI